MENSSEIIIYFQMKSLTNFVYFQRFGISYHGAAQSASGTKDEVKNIRDKSKSLFRNIELFGKSNKQVNEHRNRKSIE